MSARVCVLGRNANLVINGPGVLNICITIAHSNVYIVYFAQPQTHCHPGAPAHHTAYTYRFPHPCT